MSKTPIQKKCPLCQQTLYRDVRVLLELRCAHFVCSSCLLNSFNMYQKFDCGCLKPRIDLAKELTHAIAAKGSEELPFLQDTEVIEKPAEGMAIRYVSTQVTRTKTEELEPQIPRISHDEYMNILNKGVNVRSNEGRTTEQNLRNSGLRKLNQELNSSQFVYKEFPRDSKGKGGKN